MARPGRLPRHFRSTGGNGIRCCGRYPDAMPDAADYELAWPRALFVDEAAAVLGEFVGPQVIDACAVLLQEAFVGRGPVLDFNAAALGHFVSADSQRAFVQSLIDQAEKMLLQEDRPIWPDRGRVVGPAEAADRRHQLPSAFTDLVSDFHGRGYFARSFDDLDPDRVLAERLGAGLWPLQPARWDEDTFYGLIEVLHDQVARPRLAVRPPDGWQAPFYVVEAGRRLYRWRVNRLLDAAEIGLRLADTGEDVGRLVETVDPARAELLARVLVTPNTVAAGKVRHAIALFRDRGTDADAKRSAIVALVGVLEDRRRLLKAELLRKDEGALFEIANEFSLRHHHAGQKSDFDPVFLDWVFWWYLATIELTDRLIARQDQAAVADPPDPAAVACG